MGNWVRGLVYVHYKAHMTGQRLFLGDMTGAGREAGPEVLVWWCVW